jgi:hypothetical protein
VTAAADLRRLVDELEADTAWVDGVSRTSGLPAAAAGSLAAGVARVRRRLDDPRLHLVVVGEFGSGASTSPRGTASMGCAVLPNGARMTCRDVGRRSGVDIEC